MTGLSFPVSIILEVQQVLGLLAARQPPCALSVEVSPPGRQGRRNRRSVVLSVLLVVRAAAARRPGCGRGLCGQPILWGRQAPDLGLRCYGLTELDCQR